MGRGKVAKVQKDSRCARCAKTFRVGFYSLRILCDKCTEEQSARVAKMERDGTLSPIELEQTLQDMVDDEVRMPWEKKKKRDGR